MYNYTSNFIYYSKAIRNKIIYSNKYFDKYNFHLYLNRCKYMYNYTCNFVYRMFL